MFCVHLAELTELFNFTRQNEKKARIELLHFAHAFMYSGIKKECTAMEELKIENELELKVFINGVPDVTLMSKDLFDSFIAALELQISENVKGNDK